MKLNDFEDHIDPKILERGYFYFHDDRVDGPEIIEDNVWLATVYGSESYRVEIHTDPQNSQVISSWACNCPYDYGPVCKHVVAVLYVTAEQEDSDQVSPQNPNKSSPKDQIREIFNNTTQEDLQEFILECIKSADGFKNRFLGHFADRLEEDPVQQYRQIIRNYANAAKDCDGFIGYRSAPTLTRPLWELHDKANKLYETGQIRDSMVLCQTLIEEVSQIYEFMDESDEIAGDVIMMAFDTLNNLAEDASTTIKDELLEWSVQEVSLQKYQSYGFESHFLELLPLLVSTAEQEEQFFALLDRLIEQEKAKKWSSDYGVARLIKVKIKYFRTQDQQQEVLELLETHSRFHKFREQLVDRALKQEDFELAKNLCSEGIELAKKETHPGIIDLWRHRLFEIAKMENNVPEKRKWAETLFFSNYNIQWYRALTRIMHQEICSWARLHFAKAS